MIATFLGLGDLVPWLIGAVAAIAGILGYGYKERRAGRKEGAVKRRMQDLEGAKDVREEIDAAKRDGDAAERLRSKGRLRD